MFQTLICKIGILKFSQNFKMIGFRSIKDQNVQKCYCFIVFIDFLLLATLYAFNPNLFIYAR